MVHSHSVTLQGRFEDQINQLHVIDAGYFSLNHQVADTR